MADIIGFKADGVYTALGNGDGSDYQGIINNGYGLNGSWEIRTGEEGGRNIIGGGLVTSADSNLWDHKEDVDQDAWHHILMSYDGHDSYFYIDGVLQSISSVDEGSLLIKDNILTIGQAGFGSNSQYFKGKLDEITLYDGSFSKAFIEAQGDLIINTENVEGSAYGDVIRGNNSGNKIWGLAGDDLIYSSKGDDYIDGGLGIDTLTYELSEGAINFNYDSSIGSVIKSDGGIDIVSAIDILVATLYDDTVTGSNSADQIKGLAGDDVLFGHGGDDIITGDIGNDIIFAGMGNDHINGGFDADEISGGSGADYILGESGADKILGDDGEDYLDGGEGADKLAGGGGNDIIMGGSGSDLLLGGLGSDLIEGGLGSDIIYGGKGIDLLTGGSGADSFIVSSDNSDLDVITDFTIGEDKIIIDDTIIFSDLTFTDDHRGVTVSYVNSSGISCAILISALHSTALSASDFAKQSSLSSDYADFLANQTIDKSGFQITVTADVDHDGANDIIWSNNLGIRVIDVLTRSTVNVTDYEHLGLYAANLDSDAELEIVGYSLNHSDKLSIYDYDGSTWHENNLGLYNQESVEVIDLDGDGVSEIFMQDDQGLMVYSSDYGMHRLATGDIAAYELSTIDNDGTVDIYVTKEGHKYYSIYRDLSLTGYNYYGSLKGDLIEGSSYSDIIDASLGNDIITMSSGSDIVTGGAGNDVFFFDENIGLDRDIITDFTIGNDKFDFSGIEGSLYDRLSYDDLIASSTGNILSGILGSYELELNISFADLSLNDFIFYQDEVIESFLSGDLSDFTAQVGDYGYREHHVVDLDQDGLLDIVYATDTQGVYLYEQNLAGGDEVDYYGGWQRIYTSNVQIIEFGDLDGDGETDIVFHEGGDTVDGDLIWLEGDNRVAGNLFDVSLESFKMADIDSDNKSELLIKGSEGIYLFDHEGNPNTAHHHLIDSSLSTITTGIINGKNYVSASGNEDEALDLGLTISADSETQISAQNGTLYLIDEKLHYIPNKDFNGYDYAVIKVAESDGSYGTQIISVRIDAVNDAPEVSLISAQAVENQEIILDILANASDLDSSSLTITSVTQAANGTVELLASDSSIDGSSATRSLVEQLSTPGQIKYIPAVNFSGIDSFSYVISDGENEVTKTITIVVSNVNNAPEAVISTAETAEDKSLLIDVISPALDADGDILHIQSVSAVNGFVEIIGNNISYIPMANYHGSDEITYVISDNKGATATKQLILTINSVNDAPTSTILSAEVIEDSSVTIDILAHASDLDGDSISLAAVSEATNGSVTISSGKIIYTPDANFSGIDNFTYELSDGISSKTQTMTITVIGEDDAPLSYITSAKTDEDDLILIDVLSSAIDPEGDEISLDLVFGSTNGSVSIIDNKIQYIPDANYHGDDVITYQISDANGNVSTQNLTITVDSVNDIPILITDAASVIEDSNIVIDVLAGASDADGDLLTIANITQAANGLVAITDDNKIIYTPDANFRV